MPVNQTTGIKTIVYVPPLYFVIVGSIVCNSLFCKMTLFLPLIINSIILLVWNIDQYVPIPIAVVIADCCLVIVPSHIP